VIVLSNIGQIREVERMKDDFVANVTHELRTPLAAILLYARLLRSGKAGGDPAREARYLEIIEQQSNHIQKLVRQILELSRIEAVVAYPKNDRIHLPTFVGGLLDSLGRIADQKGLAIKTDLPSDLPTLTSNREALHLILRNLIDNAIKFTPHGEILVSAARHGDTVQLDVADQGIGIAPESVPYLFQRFYRTEAAVERGIGGTGLGLALVKETAEKLGGTISIQSRPGKGSIFSVVLPIDPL
jgi:two-component system phosphate regulon sensor histidine kinase PhoR